MRNDADAVHFHEGNWVDGEGEILAPAGEALGALVGRLKAAREQKDEWETHARQLQRVVLARMAADNETQGVVEGDTPLRYKRLENTSRTYDPARLPAYLEEAPLPACDLAAALLEAIAWVKSFDNEAVYQAVDRNPLARVIVDATSTKTSPYVRVDLVRKAFREVPA